LAYNIGNFLRTLAMPAAVEPWSLTSLQEKLIKIAAKVVSHGRYVMFQMAEVAVPRQMLHDILRLIARLQAPPAPSTRGAEIECDRRRRQRCGLMKAKQRVPAPQGEQPIVADAAPPVAGEALLLCCHRRRKTRQLCSPAPQSGECRITSDERNQCCSSTQSIRSPLH
jgi:Transposase DDE domain group 1